MLAIRPANTEIIIATLFLLSIAATSAFAEEPTRWSTSTQNTKAAHERGVAGKITESEFDALVTEGSRKTGKRSQASSKTAASQSATADDSFWFYASDVVLFNDFDQDGHFHGVDLWFDADTYYAEAEVYAVVYLSLADGPWNEYFSTDNFILFGTSADDAFNIVTELTVGYPTGSYDLLIELFDAYDDQFLTSFGPTDTSELAFLPLEDANRDIPYETTVVVRNGGGSLGWLTLLALLCVPRIAARRLP
jgi:hypothetical protein